MSKVIKKKPQDEAPYTDILEDYFKEDGVEKVKRTYLNGTKFVKEVISNN